MELVIVIIYGTGMGIIIAMFSVVLCGCGKQKASKTKSHLKRKSEFVQKPPPPPIEEKGEQGSYVSEREEVLDLNAKRASVGLSPSARPNQGTIVGIPKLPPKGEEVDVPMPKAAKKITKKGPRPKKVPKAGHTAPIRPVDEDPTMPIEDDAMANKMAAKYRPAAPIPPLPSLPK